MADKKRTRKEKTDSFAREAAWSQVPVTPDKLLDDVMRETLESVIKAECYPREYNSNYEDEDDTQVYRSRRASERYEQDPYTVAQHMQDRTQFRH